MKVTVDEQQDAPYIDLLPPFWPSDFLTRVFLYNIKPLYCTNGNKILGQVTVAKCIKNVSAGFVIFTSWFLAVGLLSYCSTQLFIDKVSKRKHPIPYASHIFFAWLFSNCLLLEVRANVNRILSVFLLTTIKLPKKSSLVGCPELGNFKFNFLQL